MEFTKELLREAMNQVKENNAAPTVAVFKGKPYTLSEMIELNKDIKNDINR